MRRFALSVRAGSVCSVDHALSLYVFALVAIHATTLPRSHIRRVGLDSKPSDGLAGEI